MSHFQYDYEAWLEDALTDGVPERVIAFTFNLYEHPGEGSRFGVEFVGTDQFDLNDSDWACGEVWGPAKGRHVDIPLSFSGETWQVCLDQMKSLIGSILLENTRLSTMLRSVNGIGIGFVDGDLSILRGA